MIAASYKTQRGGCPDSTERQRKSRVSILGGDKVKLGREKNSKDYSL